MHHVNKTMLSIHSLVYNQPIDAVNQSTEVKIKIFLPSKQSKWTAKR